MVRKKTGKTALWPRQVVAAGLALVALFFLLPMALLPEEEPASTPQPTATLPVLSPTPTPAATPLAGWDAGQTVRVLHTDGTVEATPLNEYLWSVVAAEMPASFRLEALKAQAVAARTYCLYQRGGEGEKHPGADVCTDYTCCQAYLTRDQAEAGWGEQSTDYAGKVDRAVAETDGLLCLYEGQPIDAVFFSSAAGRTLDAVAVWGAQVPYLAAVDSPEGEEVPGWHTLVTFTPEEFRERLLEACPQADLAGPPETWFGDWSVDDAGTVESVSVGGETLTGTQVRSIFGLRSAHFTVQAAKERVDFSVVGYGHGVGMSQYGANALAGEGKTFEEILKWYYTGVTVAGLPPSAPQ